MARKVKVKGLNLGFTLSDLFMASIRVNFKRNADEQANFSVHRKFKDRRRALE